MLFVLALMLHIYYNGRVELRKEKNMDNCPECGTQIEIENISIVNGIAIFELKCGCLVSENELPEEILEKIYWGE